MNVFGVTGHRGLTADQSRLVAAELRALLQPHAEAGFTGMTCLADGADTVFADVVLQLGGRLIAVIPARGYREFQPTAHLPDYDRLLHRCAEVRQADRPEPDLASLMAASELLVDESRCLLAVWDGQPARGYAGTADVVAYARQRGRPVRVIWPDGAVREPPTPTNAATPTDSG